MQVSHGSVSHCEPTVIGEAAEGGLVRVAAVSSPCENVMHSLVNTRHYTGAFLPGFTEVEEEAQDPATSDLLTHIDHVTYVCNLGDTERILAWYRDTAGMQRFLLTPDEDPEVGVVFEEVGMKLNVGDWVAEWLCREQGVHSGHTDEARNFKLVLAEPLARAADSHVNNFLRDHGGPGLQHIGLATADIARTVQLLAGAGARFRKPPPTYYRLESKRAEIAAVGESPDTFAQLGILIDRDPAGDTSTDTGTSHEGDRRKMFSVEPEQDPESVFILQLFSFPLFGPTDTFFLEIIQRHNSRGFGGGNIRALAESIVEWQRQQELLREDLLRERPSGLLKTCSHHEFAPLYQFETCQKLETLHTSFDVFHRKANLDSSTILVL